MRGSLVWGSLVRLVLKRFSEVSIACCMEYSRVGSKPSSGQSSSYSLRRNRNSILTLQLFARSTNISTPPDIPIPLMFPRLPSVHCLMFLLPGVPTGWCSHCLVFPRLPGIPTAWCFQPDVPTARCFHCPRFPHLLGVPTPVWSFHCLVLQLRDVSTPARCFHACVRVCSQMYSDMSATVFWCVCAWLFFFLLHTFYHLIISNW